MPTEDSFKATRSVYAFFNAYINTVADEIGSARAAALYAKTAEQAGEMQGKMARQEAGDRDLDAQEAFSILNRVPESMGIFTEVLEESPHLVRTMAHRCPLYESYMMAGLDEAGMEERCRSGAALFMDMEAKQLNPHLTYQITKFRTSSNDFCLEELRLE